MLNISDVLEQIITGYGPVPSNDSSYTSSAKTATENKSFGTSKISTTENGAYDSSSKASSMPGVVTADRFQRAQVHVANVLTSAMSPTEDQSSVGTGSHDLTSSGHSPTGAHTGVSSVVRDLGTSHRVVSRAIMNISDSTVNDIIGDVTHDGVWTAQPWNPSMPNNLSDGWFFNPDIENTSVANTTEMVIPEGYLSGYTLEGVIIASILVTALMLIIIIGNALVIIAICVDRNLQSVQHWFIASLAVSDLFVGLLIMPLSLANELMGYWYFGNILCELWLATDVLLCTASILNLVLISLDRYWSITRAVSYVKQRTQQRAALMIAIVWIASMIICFPPLVGWKRPQPMLYNLPLCVLTDDLGYVVYSTLGSFYIPLIVMVIVYFKIYLAARSRARRNLKKKKTTQQVQNVAENGKSSSTTTTSFATPKFDQNLEDLDSSSKEEPSEIPPNKQNQHSQQKAAKSERQQAKDDHHVHFKVALDEKKKLLSDDTDSACDSPRTRKSGLGGPIKRAHFSEETDSTSEGINNKSAYTNYKGDEDASGEDNLKPLLEGDSQPESDYQTDSAPNVVNNNQTTSGKSDTETENQLNQQKLPKKPGKSNEARQSDVNKKRGVLLTPTSFSSHTNGRKLTPSLREKHKREDPEKQKRRIARAKERRATLVLGIIMATFIGCWLPFFSTYLISSLTGLDVPEVVFDIFFWGGYCNSGLNPVIYTIFNRDFRQAFHKIICGRRKAYF